jgi:hypothetical protein
LLPFIFYDFSIWATCDIELRLKLEEALDGGVRLGAHEAHYILVDHHVAHGDGAG